MLDLSAILGPNNTVAESPGQIGPPQDPTEPFMRPLAAMGPQTPTAPAPAAESAPTPDIAALLAALQQNAAAGGPGASATPPGPQQPTGFAAIIAALAPVLAGVTAAKAGTGFGSFMEGQQTQQKLMADIENQQVGRQMQLATLQQRADEHQGILETRLQGLKDKQAAALQKQRDQEDKMLAKVSDFAKRTLTAQVDPETGTIPQSILNGTAVNVQDGDIAKILGPSTTLAALAKWYGVALDEHGDAKLQPRAPVQKSKETLAYSAAGGGPEGERSQAALDLLDKSANKATPDNEFQTFKKAIAEKAGLTADQFDKLPAAQREAAVMKYREATTQLSIAGADARQATSIENATVVKAREHIDKAAEQYFDAKKKAAAIKNAVVLGASGNDLAASLQNVLTVLGASSIEDVRRISNVELGQVAGFGSIMTRVENAFRRGLTGNDLDAGEQKAFKDFADMLAKTSYSKYSDLFDYQTGQVDIPGLNKLPAPGEVPVKRDKNGQLQ